LKCANKLDTLILIHVHNEERIATSWTVWGSKTGGGEVILTRPDRARGPPSLQYNGYSVFPGGTEDGAWL